MKNILQIKNLSVFINGTEILKNIDFTVKEGQSLGIIGVSGSGKTVMMYAITSLLPKLSEVTGKIIVDGQTDILTLSEKEKRVFCSKNISIILQNSINSLNPYKKIYTQFVETARLYNNSSREKALTKVFSLLEELGMSTKVKDYDKYPHEYSGGMRQQTAIALCLLNSPKILIADEPTTSLDAINQLKFINYIQSVCNKKNITLIYITHNFGLTLKICKDIIVLKDGEIVEKGNPENVFIKPKHVYTEILVNSAKQMMRD
ncbi:ABC transporter ATP-binding protein [Treponema pedis]|uniref:Oligopeptide/dipeptide ABC transporter ATPase n=1 Tax=Treponema pedis str. T A4 TaxID=1291379 RepID=S5ZPD1_9SPIR|nr:ABC transporter ATP-binding protein [Treponema pedis]AGT44477.1 oligopeptide/dipeptide ABC transporter ATPase [Treponema pedis str. T A4]